MGWIAIGSFLGRRMAIAIAGAAAYVMASHVLDWL
jgi:hypothetical protein